MAGLRARLPWLRVRDDPARRAGGLLRRRAAARSPSRAWRSTRSTPSTPPGSTRCRSARSTRSGPPTARCSSGRRCGPSRSGTGCGSRSRRPSSPAESATAGTCTSRPGGTARTCTRTGDGRYGMTADGEAFAAGVLDALPALAAITTPSPASYLRLQPSHWAGIYACWGHETRESALRVVTGMVGNRERAANLEVKCADLAANPYLLIAGVLAAGLDGIAAGADAARGDHRRPRSVSTPPRPSSGASGGCRRRCRRRSRRSRQRAPCRRRRSATSSSTPSSPSGAVRRPGARAWTPEAVAEAYRWVY